MDGGGSAWARGGAGLPFLVALACASAEPPVDSAPPATTQPTVQRPEGTDLVDVAAWVILGADDDPFADHRPAAPDCHPTAIEVEDGILEIETQLCDYLSAGQPSLADVRAGDTLHLTAYHSSLTWWTDAEAHMAVALGGVVVWDEVIPIPSAPGVYTVAVEATVDAPVGTPVVVHLHNHGSNTWNLDHLRVAPR